MGYHEHKKQWMIHKSKGNSISTDGSDFPSSFCYVTGMNLPQVVEQLKQKGISVYAVTLEGDVFISRIIETAVLSL
ncbi:MAG: hypothetical protein ACLVIY_04525 [Anaerobutyricum soehngenii]